MRWPADCADVVEDWRAARDPDWWQGAVAVAAADLEQYIERAYRVTAERIAAGEVSDEDPAS